MRKQTKPRPLAFAMVNSNILPFLTHEISLVASSRKTQKDAYKDLVEAIKGRGLGEIPSFSAFNRFVRQSISAESMREAIARAGGTSVRAGEKRKPLSEFSEEELISELAKRTGGRVWIRVPARSERRDA